MVSSQAEGADPVEELATPICCRLLRSMSTPSEAFTLLGRRACSIVYRARADQVQLPTVDFRVHYLCYVAHAKALMLQYLQEEQS